MSLFKKVQKWWNRQEHKKISEFTRYKLIITLVDGEVIECYSDRYHCNLISFTSYYTTMNEKGVLISGKFYPMHMIKSVEDEPIDTKLVYQKDDFYGVFGLSHDEIEENQNKWKDIIEKYKNEY